MRIDAHPAEAPPGRILEPGAPGTPIRAPASSILPDPHPRGERPIGFEGYTSARYHEALRKLSALRWPYAILLAAMTTISGLLFVGVRVPTNPIGMDLSWLTIAWLLPFPLLVLATLVYFGWFSVRRFSLRSAPRPIEGARPKVIFQITSTGLNVETVRNTARSSLYWTGQHPHMGYDPEVWLVVEGWGYAPNRERLDELSKEGVRIVVVPTDYQTSRGTTRKGRALQYATETRRKLGLDLTKLWIYHQDDETAIGEDTVLGIDEFVADHDREPSVGCGIILYSQGAEDYRPSQIQEFSRTKDDLRTLYTITSRQNMFSGFHGSHYIARGDLEDTVAWDVGPEMNSEDLIFETRVRAQYGPVFHLLKGFAHEQAALNLRDQFKQRRRWFQGWWRAVLHQPFPLTRRIVMSYGMVVWMAALFSVIAMFSSWVFGFSSILPYTGSLTGFVWAVMVVGYYQGYVLHTPYLPARRVGLVRVVANAVVGAWADALAPWYGTFTRRARSFQVIAKDRSLPTPAREIPVGGGMSPSRSLSMSR